MVPDILLPSSRCTTLDQITCWRISNMVLKLENCQVTANVRTVRDDKSEYHAVQVAATDRTAKTATKQMLGHFSKAGVPPKRIVKEFPVTPDAHVPVGRSTCFSEGSCIYELTLHKGTTLSAIHFVPGQFVDVISNSYVDSTCISLNKTLNDCMLPV